jgi:hypothetical protein
VYCDSASNNDIVSAISGYEGTEVFKIAKHSVGRQKYFHYSTSTLVIDQNGTKK